MGGFVIEELSKLSSIFPFRDQFLATARWYAGAVFIILFVDLF